MQALKAGAPDDVTSPTFTLVHEYEGPKTHIFHLDLYRLETERELATLGLEEMAANRERAGAGGVGREVPFERAGYGASGGGDGAA